MQLDQCSTVDPLVGCRESRCAPLVGPISARAVVCSASTAVVRLPVRRGSLADLTPLPEGMTLAMGTLDRTAGDARQRLSTSDVRSKSSL